MRGNETHLSAGAALMLAAAIVAAIGIGAYYAVETVLGALD